MCNHKNESGKCSKFGTIKTTYEYRFKISLESKGQISCHLNSPIFNLEYNI